MQYPVGMVFNPDTARNEMSNFWDVILSPVAISKFLHTIGSGYVISALFVIGISAWLILKGKDMYMAKKSMIIGATFGLITSLFLILSGDESADQVALTQPVKLAAMEGMYDGKREAGIVALGVLNTEKTLTNDEPTYLFELEIPYALSLLGYHDTNAYVAGLKDLVWGNEEMGIMSASEKIAKGKVALEAFKTYKEAKAINDEESAILAKATLEENMAYFGYGYLKKPEDIVPPIGLTFYSFHIMVALGSWFLVLFALVLFLVTKKEISNYPIVLKSALWSIPLGYIAAEAGWIVAEVGRQPWAIQDLMPVGVAVTNISSTNVMITFWMFAVLFTALLIAEIKIMTKQISLGFNGGH